MNLDGSYSNEFEAAHDLSNLTQDRHDDTGRIRDLVAQGRFVVECRFPRYCRFTDALLRNDHVFLKSDHATREEADAAVRAIHGEDEQFEGTLIVHPELPRVVVCAESSEEDECPF